MAWPWTGQKLCRSYQANFPSDFFRRRVQRFISTPLLKAAAIPGAFVSVRKSRWTRLFLPDKISTFESSHSMELFGEAVRFTLDFLVGIAVELVGEVTALGRNPDR